MKKNSLLLGAHLSVAGGYDQAFVRANQLGCTALQIFTKSNRQWAATPITTQQANTFKKTWHASPDVQSVIVHASYLINIASSNELLGNKSIASLIEELERCYQLGINYMVLHPGSHGSDSLKEGIKRAGKQLSQALKNSPSSVSILLENTAGQGSSIGGTFEQLQALREATSHPERIHFCFDTCHAFVAGYSFGTKTEYEDLWHTIDKAIGLSSIKAFHVNDSMKGLGSKSDRHQHIGQGKIGLEAFSMLMNDKTFAHVPKILETPKSSTSMELDSMNLKTLKDLLTPTMKKWYNLE